MMFSLVPIVSETLGLRGMGIRCGWKLAAGLPASAPPAPMLRG
jgi:hypothetical protein